MTNVFKTWSRKDKRMTKSQYESKHYVENFYGSGTQGEQTKRFHFAHFVLKYKLLIPAMLLVKKVLGKRLVTKVGPEPQFKYVKLLNKIVDEASIEWNHIYINSLRKKQSSLDECRIQYYNSKGTNSNALVKLCKEIGVTICVNDDAYADYIPFFLWRTYFEMRKLVEAGEKDHLMRCVPGQMNNIDELRYLKLVKQRTKDDMSTETELAGVQR